MLSESSNLCSMCFGNAAYRFLFMKNDRGDFVSKHGRVSMKFVPELTEKHVSM